MKIKDVMVADVEAVEHHASLHEAAYLMRSAGVGNLPVVRDERVVGVITGGDILSRAVAEGLDTVSTRVRDVMTRSVVTCREEDDVEVARCLMLERALRRLVVVDADGGLAGILAAADLEAHESGAGRRRAGAVV